ncbi:MAG: SDR family oxidoreductase [Betaproteobacteria bacterium]|jgi:short-subunit dehydrogenase
MNVFLTGASSGIGAELAKVYAARGATLGLVARRQSLLDELRARLPGTHHAYAVDVTDRDALIAAAREFEAATGGADVVIANAGISVGVLTEYYEDLDSFREVFDVNVLALATTFHPFIGPMRARGRGQLVGIGSVAGIRGLPGSEAYCASKSAVITYCESLRVELARFGVRVQTISPGFVRTPLTAKNRYAMPFLLDPGDFARRAVRAIDRGRSYATIPWQMGVVAKLLRVLPNAVFDRLFANRAYKPRKREM